MSHECTVINKESFLDEAVDGLCFSTQLPKVKDATIIAEAEYTPSSMFPTACLRTLGKNRLNRTGTRTQPCLTPLEMEKGYDCSLLERTCPVISSWKRRMI